MADLIADSPVDVLVRDADLVATVDDHRTEIRGGWVAVRGGLIAGVGSRGSEPAALRTLDARSCLVTPGLINTHHHIYQNLTRAYLPAVNGTLFMVTENPNNLYAIKK